MRLGESPKVAALFCYINLLDTYDEPVQCLCNIINFLDLPITVRPTASAYTTAAPNRSQRATTTIARYFAAAKYPFIMIYHVS